MREIELHVQGLGPVPNFKNSKMVVRGIPRTKPEYQKWMKRCVDSLVSQFVSIIQTADDGTFTEQQKRSLIVWLLPEDDCWTCIPQENFLAMLNPKGEEGARISIRKL